MEDKTAEIIIQPKPETKEPLAASQLKSFTLDLILCGEVNERGKGISTLIEKSAEENWGQSQDPKLKLLYYDLHMVGCQNELEGIRRAFLEKPITPEVTDRIEELERKIEELKTERGKLAPEFDNELKSTNIVGLLAREFADPEKPWIIENIEKDMMNSFYWIINSYDGEARMLAWMKKNGLNKTLVEFYQDRHDGRLFDHLKSFKVKASDGDEQVGIDNSLRSLMKNIYSRRYDNFPLETIRRFKSLLDDPENNDKFSQILQLTSDQYRKMQYDRFKRGEIDFLPNIQENLRPILFVDLYDRLFTQVDHPTAVFAEWYDFWHLETWNEERTQSFMGLLLDEGYPNVVDHPPVTDIDRTSVLKRLRYLMSPKPGEETGASDKNRAIAEKPTDEIIVSEHALFQETDFSLLPQLVSSGILANELTYHSRNAASGRESDLSASFWRLAADRNRGAISLGKAIDVFYPEGNRGVKTGASLRNRVVICSLEPTRQGDQDFFIYPPYSDAMHQYDASAPMAKKFATGWDNNHMPTQYDDIKKDAVFVLLGLPPTRFNFVVIPPSLKERYADMVKDLPFYLPAYSSETGERIF